jgi:hypothetical protein
MKSDSWPKFGCGVGLRSPHYPVITETWPQVDWFEAISENYMDTGGRPLQILETVRRHYPVALHGTALSIGSVDPVNPNYLARLKKLIERIEPFVVSDHLCWSGVGRETLHDLLPLPFTEEAIRHVRGRVEYVQEFLGRPILLENVSSYVTYRHSTIPEWEFVSEVARRSGCGILLDLNNIYVNATNHGFDPFDYLKGIPGERVGQFHLAGHTDMGSFLFDTHGSPVIHPVWELYRRALELWGPVSTLIEWDEQIPPFERLLEEAEKAKRIYREIEVRGAQRRLSPVEGRIEAGRTLENIGPRLSEVEQWFKEQIQPCGRDSSCPERGDAFLNPQGGVRGEERLQVYASGYVARIREGLAEAYEAVRWALGEEGFRRLAREYAVRFPSGNYNLSLVGRRLPEFLEKSPWKEEFPFLSDLARLEWQMVESFHAFDGPPLDPSRLAEIPEDEWEKARLVFQPSVGLVASHWPILDLWKARKMPPGEMKKEWGAQPQRVLVSRRGVQVWCELLDANQYRLLQGLISGESLGAACETLAAAGEELPFVSDWFSHWVRTGLIGQIVIPETLRR